MCPEGHPFILFSHPVLWQPSVVSQFTKILRSVVRTCAIKSVQQSISQIEQFWFLQANLFKRKGDE